MTRKALPNRRPAETFEFSHASEQGLQPLQFVATVGVGDDGQIAEVFLNATKMGTGADASARDAAIAVSLALQHGVDVAVLRGAMTRNANGWPSSPIGRLLDLLEGDPGQAGRAPAAGALG